MRVCEYCELTVGNTYILVGNGKTECCGVSGDDDGKEVLYVGYDGAFHYFRYLRSFPCPSCGQRMFQITMPCSYFRDGLFVREDREIEVEK